MAALEARGGDSHNGVGPKGASGGDAVPPQLTPTEGLPERKAERRRQERVARMLHDVRRGDRRARSAQSLPEDLLAQADSGAYEPTAGRRRPALGARARRRRQPAAPAPPPRCPGRAVRRDGDRQAEGPGAARREVLADPPARGQRQPLRLRPGHHAGAAQAPVPAPRVHPADLVHRQRHDPADGAGRDPLRRGHRAAAGLADPAARRPVVHRVGLGARGAARGQPDRHRAAHRRRRRLGDLRRPGRPQDPRRDRRHGGAGHQPDPAPGRAPGARPAMLVAVLLNGLVSVVGVAGGYFFNVILQGGTPGRLPGLVQRAGPGAGLLVRGDQGADLRADRRRSSPPTRGCAPAAARRASATR